MTENRAARSHRIVVGVDGSEESLAALDWAAGMAEATSSTVEVIAAWEWPTRYGVALVLPSNYDPVTDAEVMVSRAVKVVQEDHPAVAFAPVVVEGHPAQVLVEASRGADLLAVGSRGHGAFTGMLIGSVSEHCAANAHCPVLIIRHQRS